MNNLKQIFKITKFLVIANIVAIIVYLYIDYLTWPTIAQQGIALEMRVADSNELRFLICLPIQFLYLVINIIWLIFVFLFLGRTKDWISSAKLMLIWMLVLFSWYAACTYDYYRFHQEGDHIKYLRKHGLGSPSFFP